MGSRRIQGRSHPLVRHVARMQAEATSRWALAHARFKGALRRLAVPDAAEYDEEEYTEAIEAFFSATKAFSGHSRLASSIQDATGIQWFTENCCRSPD